METNRIIEELNAFAQMDWGPDQKAYYVQRAKDAKPVECVPMRDVFTRGQMLFLREHYKARQKMCYKNASILVSLIAMNSRFDGKIRYVEGFAYAAGILPIEHAFVKVGDKYIDPTFERALHKDVRKESYVSCIELDPFTMDRYLIETGTFGELYQYDYFKRNRPELAARIRAMNPHNR